MWLHLLLNANHSTVVRTRRCVRVCVCGSEWSRVVTHAARGAGPTLGQAESEAKRAVERAFAEPLAEPCPACGRYDRRHVARLRRALWRLPLCVAVVWLGLVALAALLLLAARQPGDPPSPELVAVLVAGGTAGLTLLLARLVRQRGFDPNRDAERRRGARHDPLHVSDVAAALNGIRHQAPSQIDRAIELFVALDGTGEWSVDGALAESLRRCFGGGRVPPSLPAALGALKRYGETPLVDASLGKTSLR